MKRIVFVTMLLAFLLAFSGCKSDVIIADKKESDKEIENLAGEKNKDFDFQYEFNSDNTIIITSYENRNTVDLVIPSEIEGHEVKSIKDDAFVNYLNLKTVSFQNGVEEIGKNNFSYCSNLTSINLPESLISIGEESFSECGLTRVSIPDSVEKIGLNAFYNCESLEAITIGEGVYEIVNGAFTHCVNLERIEVSPENSVFCSKNNCLIVSDTGAIILGCNNSIIPDDGSIKEIADDAFYGCSSLTSISIPDSVRRIGDYAFSYCGNLETISLGKGIEEIEYDAFEGTAYYDNVENWEDGVLYIGKYLVETDKEKVKDEYTVKSGTLMICNNVFEECSNLKSITFPDSVKVIGKVAFSGCDSLEKVNFGKGIETIKDNAFTGCESLKKISIPDSVTDIEDSAFYDCKFEYVKMGKGLTEIPRQLISAVNLKTFIIGNSVTNIGGYCFGYCEGLTSITIPDSVSIIEYSAFEGCTGLTSIKIPNSVKVIEENAFSGCTKLSSITITNASISIGFDAFSATAYVENKNNWQEDILYIGKHLIMANNKIKGTCQIRRGTVDIADGAFSECSGLNNIIIPETVTEIGDFAFSRCTWLESVVISNGVKRIGSCAFCGCVNMKRLYLPNSVKTIGWDALNFKLVDEYTRERNTAEIIYIGSEKDWKNIDFESDEYDETDNDYLNELSITYRPQLKSIF